jgi:hypothetical protein
VTLTLAAQMNMKTEKKLTILLTVLTLAGLFVFPFLMRTYAFEAWIQFHYRVEESKATTPAFLVFQRDLWWLWFSFPVAALISAILFLIEKQTMRSQLVVLCCLLLVFGSALVAYVHKTFWIWLSTFGRML